MIGACFASVVVWESEYIIVFSFSERYGFGSEADIGGISAVVICEVYASAFSIWFIDIVTDNLYDLKIYC